MPTRKAALARPDPMEALVAGALTRAGEAFATERGNTARLDFYLPRFGVHLEVKQFHSGRIAVQMGRVDDVIVAQGPRAVRLLAALMEEGIAKVDVGPGPGNPSPDEEGNG